MSDPFIGEIRMFAGNFAPANWAFCNGQLIPISENEALFGLIGTTYGGDGQSTYALPNLQSRVPVHMGTGPDGVTYPLGQMAGVESVILTTQQIPSHTHPMLATSSGQVLNPASNTTIATALSPTVQGLKLFSPAPATVPLKSDNIAPAGGSQPHNNIQPYLCVSFIIALYGIFPPQS